MLDLLLRRRTGLGFEESVLERLGNRITFGAPPRASRGHVSLPGQHPVPVPSTYAPTAAAAGTTWWATADLLLDLAAMHLDPEQGSFEASDLRALRTPTAPLPGSTVFDAWGLGWAT